MRKFLGALIVALGLVAAPPAHAGTTVNERWVDARTLDLTWHSANVGEDVSARVLLPSGWTRNTRRTWPVVYAFQGGRDDYTSWTRETDIEKLAARYDVMVVMPSGGENGSYVDWWNDGKGGIPRWETFHTVELPKLMARYHAGTRRATLGVSSGGQGAVAYAARHPGMYEYAASFSGSTHLTMDGMQLFLTTVNLLGSGPDAFRIFGLPGRDDANWRAHDPYVQAAHLRGTGLYISSGTTGMNGPYTPPGGVWRLTQLSEILIGQMNRSFVDRLHTLKIPVTSHIYGDGWHAWPEWTHELHTAWPLIMRALGASR
ncbi:Diacylglycerol acyltransferase/mycolyltransferase Ag85B precursor [Actinomadura rubteroloni]|uniref:Diacylglycerol acyltransferase/mycolyltransferase Ag85B n=1 Tax=Actinomadura rubteroloni TaxID=1926885 RepID=A0A2P4US41_9ACTN|nr:alpha/beta hydrolase-fold protein [Actinomadura rubteroloni]POM27858.1 Diacylglycerol acyltransferase/mycolyltransferase Ag85B precursor [Actinomadura rubteroloni]